MIIASSRTPAAGEVGEDLAQLVLLERELLAHLDRRGAMTQARDEERIFMTRAGRGGRRPRLEREPGAAQKPAMAK